MVKGKYAASLSLTEKVDFAPSGQARFSIA